MSTLIVCAAAPSAFVARRCTREHRAAPIKTTLVACAAAGGESNALRLTREH
jgi:hypothetical protein